MNDNFSSEIEKLKKCEKSLKSDYISREEADKKGKPTSIVITRNPNI